MTYPVSQTLPEHLARRVSAKRGEKLTKWLFAAAAIVCLVSAGMLLPRINEIRKERQLVVDSTTIAGLPAHLALLQRLGTFRGVLITFASIKATKLQEQGRYYEAYDLHKLVCSAAPRFAKIWGYSAWNMAYNISVMKYSPEERWKWVKNGIKVLRDEGIQYNPRSATLYKELTWILWHKVGGYLDDHHLDYKKGLAVEMEAVLGAPPVTLNSQEYFDWFRKIAEAPIDVAGTLESEVTLQPLLAKLGQVGLTPDDALLEFVARHIRPELSVDALLAQEVDRDSLLTRQLGVVTDPANAEPLEYLLAMLRADSLRRVYKMDPRIMLRMMEKQYGPLDWRNAFAHGLYWSELGDEISEGHQASNLNDRINNARQLLMSLQSIVTRGKIVLWPDFDKPFNSHIAETPDTRVIPYLFDTYMRLGKKHFGDRPEYREGTPGPIYRNGFVTNMQSWVELLYLEGGDRNEKLANSYFAWLRENNPHPNGATQERYLGTIAEFINEGFKERIFTYTAINGQVRNLIERGLKHFSLNQPKQAVRSITRARLAYEHWMKDTRVDINDRRKMQPFYVLLDDQIEAFMRQAQYAPIYKARLWKMLPVKPRQEVYDWLNPYFERLCDEQVPKWSAARAFPEPPGMAEARSAGRTYRGKKRTDIEQGEKVIMP